MQAEIKTAVDRIAQAVARFKPAAVFALFSGGHDSLAASHIANLHGVDGVVHVNTGIGIPETRDFAEATCAEHGWKFLEYKASENTNRAGEFDPQIYDEMVIKHGFPGPYMHRKMYSRLKERQIEKLGRDYKRTLLISGCRQQESVRRMGTAQEYQAQGNRCWVAPLWDWTKSMCSDALGTKYKRNQAALRFGRSGECLCGAFAQRGELAALRFACPKSYERIRALEVKVREAGFPWGWEDPGPPQWWREKNAGQLFMFNYDVDETPSTTGEDLCSSCKWRAL